MVVVVVVVLVVVLVLVAVVVVVLVQVAVVVVVLVLVVVVPDSWYGAHDRNYIFGCNRQLSNCVHLQPCGRMRTWERVLVACTGITASSQNNNFLSSVVDVKFRRITTVVLSAY
jgi:hypothetical protein